MITNIPTRKRQTPDDTVAERRGPARGRSDLPVDASIQAEASSANARINVPLNLENWRHLPKQHVDLLLWYHQHLLDEGIGWNAAVKTLQSPEGEYYSRSTIFRALKGTYDGPWENICDAIETYRGKWIRGQKARATEFRSTPVTEAIFAGLDYALHAPGIVQIVGESGQGKTFSAEEWQERNNHGRTVMVECPVMGGMKGLLREICGATGHNKNQSIMQMQDCLRRAFSPGRILIIDEPARLLPSDRDTPPRTLDFFRWLQEQTGCGLAFLVTARFDEALAENSWMFEQLIGRIDHYVYLPADMEEATWLPLVQSYLPNPSPKVLAIAGELANRPMSGRLRRLSKILKFAWDIAKAQQEPVDERHFLAAAKRMTPKKPATAIKRKSARRG